MKGKENIQAIVKDKNKRRKTWTEQEDKKILKLIKKFGPAKWAQIARHMKGRIGKQCRERWHNHLKPNIKRTPWTEEEEFILFLFHKQIGNHWADISKKITGRSDNAIKNYWNSNMKKKMGKYLRLFKNLSQSINDETEITDKMLLNPIIDDLVRKLTEMGDKDYHSLYGSHGTSLRVRRGRKQKRKLEIAKKQQAIKNIVNNKSEEKQDTVPQKIEQNQQVNNFQITINLFQQNNNFNFEINKAKSTRTTETNSTYHDDINDQNIKNTPEKANQCHDDYYFSNHNNCNNFLENRFLFNNIDYSVANPNELFMNSQKNQHCNHNSKENIYENNCIGMSPIRKKRVKAAKSNADFVQLEENYYTNYRKQLKTEYPTDLVQDSFFNDDYESIDQFFNDTITPETSFITNFQELY